MTNSPKPEFSLIKKLSDLGSAVQENASANSDQRNALAKRFELLSIGSMQAHYKLDPLPEKIMFSGMLKADLVQSCAISGQEIPVHIEEEFKIAFVPKSDAPTEEEEVELSADDCDVIEYDGNQIDLGEALSQTLYLALDPYPRAPDAVEVAREKGLKSEEEAGPFGALAALKDKLG